MVTKLHEPVFRPLPMAAISPQGWLRRQLEIQAAGLSGNLDKFWPDIKDSQWIGGSAEGWERVPYWLDGFIPLAWLLDDEDMKARAQHYIDCIIASQKEDGWLCPGEESGRARYDAWALLLMLKVLVVYQGFSGDERVEGVVRRALLALDRHLDTAPLFNWGQMRWFEGLIAIWWLYERTGEKWLLDLAVKLHAQGFDWLSFFARWPMCEPTPRGRWSYVNHVVNNAMMLKSGALWWRLTGDEEHLHAAEDIVRQLDECHGMVTGVFTGDECLAGTSPVQGTELCAVAEYMYSLEHLLAITGRAHWGDRLESIAYNALPATFSPDMWTHQYDQQVNQVECSRQSEQVFLTNGPESNLFGLEPNYGCCTANLSQAWPKLALSTVMRSADGLAVGVYAPFAVDTQVGDARVQLTLDTAYPFRDTLRFSLETDRSVSFALWLRIPSWAEGATLELAGEMIPVTPGSFHRLEREWQGTTVFKLHLPMQTELVARPSNLHALRRGPLVYSLRIGERWVRTNEDVPGREPPHCDYEVFATTPWNYGLCLDPGALEEVTFEERPLGDCIFSPEGAPVVARVRGRKVEWHKERGAATPVPAMGWVADEVEELELIPYGCTNLRMTEMPLVR